MSRAEKMKSLWEDPIYRAEMIEKQKQIGLRNYGDGIFYKKNRKKTY